MMLRRSALFILALFMVNLFHVSAVDASWQQLGNTLNVLSTTGYAPSLAFNGTTPYVAWSEYLSVNDRTYVKKYDGSEWVQVGGMININPIASADHPCLVSNGGTSYIAWRENSIFDSLIHVKRFNGTDWELVGNTLNVNADSDSATNNRHSISMAFYNDIPYVTWSEDTGAYLHVLVKRYNGMDWELVGNTLNVSALKNAKNPNIAFSGSTPFVTWVESTDHYDEQIYVKHYDGANWVQDGGGIKVSLYDGNGRPDHPYLAFNGTTPYVAWGEDLYIRVKHFNGTDWVQDGGGINLSGSDTVTVDYPNLVFLGNTPYVSWDDYSMTSFYVYFRYYNGVEWVSNGEDRVTSNNSKWSNLAFCGTTPYIALIDRLGTNSFVSVRHWVTDTPTPTATCTRILSPTTTPTIQMTPTVTPTATVSRPDMGMDDVMTFPSPARGGMIRFYYRTVGPAEVLIEIYNAAGEHCASVKDIAYQAEYHQTPWDISGMAPGIYLYRVNLKEANGERPLPIKKLAIIR